MIGTKSGNLRKKIKAGLRSMLREAVLPTLKEKKVYPRRLFKSDFLILTSRLLRGMDFLWGG